MKHRNSCLWQFLWPNKLAKQLTKVRKDGTLSYLRPDGKTQVTIEYDDDKAVRVDTIVLSTQHDPNVAHVTLCDDILKSCH